MLSSDIYKSRLIALVIDEVHCVQTWGSDFRVEYGNLAEL